MNETALFFSGIQLGEIVVVYDKLKTNLELVKVKDSRGFTPLIFAAYFDKIDIVKSLIKHNALIDDRDALR